MDHDNDQRLFANYKNALKREKMVVFTLQTISLVGFFGLWELASRMYWINPLHFSSPIKIFKLLVANFSDGSIFVHLQATLFETVLGSVIGTVMGIIIASILWSSIRISQIMNPYLVVMNAMPKIALGPVIIVALGTGYISIIAVGAIIPAAITTFTVYSAFKKVDSNYEKVLTSFGATRGQIFKEAVFPVSLPTMISTLKVNVGLSWVGVIVGEFLVSNEGLGYLIIYGFRVSDSTLIMASLMLVAICATIMYKIAERIEGWLVNHTG